MRETHETAEMSDDLQKDLGRTIQRLRLARSMSQATLGEFAGLDQPAMSKIEKGDQGLSLETMSGVSRGLGLSISELWAAVEGQKKSGEAASPIAVIRPKKAKAQSHVDQDIDALRYGQGAIAVALATMLQGAGELILERLNNPKIPTAYLEKEGSLFALREAVADALKEAAAAQKAKARKRPRSRGAG
jgi:transcriptional regulator with XRE-family HTH domain